MRRFRAGYKVEKLDQARIIPDTLRMQVKFTVQTTEKERHLDFWMEASVTLFCLSMYFLEH